MPAAPHEVSDTIQYLTGQSDDRFSEALADNIMEPDEVETAAFRSPELVARSLAAAKYLIDHVNTVMRTRTGPDASDKYKRARTEHFKNRVRYEARLLEEIKTSLDLQKGIIRNSPNPRARAMKRLWQLNLAGDVPQGLANQLLAEEEQKVIDARREARRKAKEAARDRRRGLSPV